MRPIPWWSARAEVEIKIITKKIKGRFIRNFLPSPAIFENNLTHCVLKIKIINFTGQEIVNIQPRLRFGEDFNRRLIGSKKSLDIKNEKEFTVWNFKPYESGKNRLELWIYGLDPKNDLVLDDFDSQLKFYNGKVVVYQRTFNVYSFTDYIIFWFAIISTIGAIAEIINLLLTHFLRVHAKVLTARDIIGSNADGSTYKRPFLNYISK